MDERLLIELDLDEAIFEHRVEGLVMLDAADARSRTRGVEVSLWRSRPRRYELTDGTAAIRLDLRCAVGTGTDRRLSKLMVSADFAVAPGTQIAAISPTSGPGVQAFGPRFANARWVFEAAGEQELGVDHELALLVTTPVSAPAIPTTVTVRADVTLTGLRGWLPLVGRRNTTFTAHDETIVTD